MASAAASSSESCSMEKHLTCSICMDTFNDPVTTDCGHSFCKNCLNLHFNYTDRVCPLCKKPQNRTPDVNIVLRDIIQQQKPKNTEEQNDDLYTGKDGEVACDICTEQKLKAKKSCLVCLASYCDTHLENHSSTERLKGHKLVAPVKNLDDRACLKHGRPLELYSRKQHRCICVRCMGEGPEEVVSTEDEWEKKKVKLDNAKTELEEKIKKRETQLDEMNKSLRTCKDQLDNEWWDIEAVFTAVLAIVEEAQAQALQPLKDRRQVLEKEADDLKKELEAEISCFKTTISELDDISTLEDHIQFLQSYPSLQDLDDIKDWAEVELDTSLSFGTMRKTTAIMMEQIQQEMEKLTSIELKRVPKFSVDVTLDPTTAHQRLVLSHDGKEVMDGGEDQEVDDAPERFDMFGSVLGINSLTSGRSYWEVEVSNKTGWDLGVARGNANRKGKLSLNPDNGYWVTVHYEDEKYAAMTAPPVRLSLDDKPQKVGLFVDYEEGLVSFYNLTAQSHVYSFTECSFIDELFPYFSPHVKKDDKNGDPLIISAVKQCEQNMDES
ncbi:E3 ubiquitin-protein ligase TRIM39-like [Trachinotus anak]|uniref:E3 ubiquitin-protein ligase TRIM39-like n=1 Tax=Trachinotus anak TaxID=443729 RepID=UPI0039F1B1DA